MDAKIRKLAQGISALAELSEFHSVLIAEQSKEAKNIHAEIRGLREEVAALRERLGQTAPKEVADAGAGDA